MSNSGPNVSVYRIQVSAQGVEVDDVNHIQNCGEGKPLRIAGLNRTPKIMFYNIDGYAFSYLVLELQRSTVYRNIFLKRFLQTSEWYFRFNISTLNVIGVLRRAHKDVLDSMGNCLANSYIVEKCELDVALSWLSTLGGAFSALGDNSTSYAAEAGRVSITQLKIAMKLKDPLIASRCRLYAAISLLQQGYLKSARDIVKSEYKYALSLPEGQDPRLKRMCFGVWAKLQYFWALSLMEKRGVETFEEIFTKWSEIRMRKNEAKISHKTRVENSKIILLPISEVSKGSNQCDVLQTEVRFSYQVHDEGFQRDDHTKQGVAEYKKRKLQTVPAS